MPEQEKIVQDGIAKEGLHVKSVTWALSWRMNSKINIDSGGDRMMFQMVNTLNQK